MDIRNPRLTKPSRALEAAIREKALGGTGAAACWKDSYYWSIGLQTDHFRRNRALPGACYVMLFASGPLQHPMPISIPPPSCDAM